MACAVDGTNATTFIANDGRSEYSVHTDDKATLLYLRDQGGVDEDVVVQVVERSEGLLLPFPEGATAVSCASRVSATGERRTKAAPPCRQCSGPRDRTDGLEVDGDEPGMPALGRRFLVPVHR
jgi:hypothetical protein